MQISWWKYSLSYFCTSLRGSKFGVAFLYKKRRKNSTMKRIKIFKDSKIEIYFLSESENYQARKICDWDLGSKSCNPAVQNRETNNLGPKSFLLINSRKQKKFERTNLFLEKPEQKCPILKEKPCLASFSPAEHEVFAYFQWWQPNRIAILIFIIIYLELCSHLLVETYAYIYIYIYLSIAWKFRQ